MVIYVKKYQFISSRTNLLSNHKLLDTCNIEVLHDENHHYSLIHYEILNEEQIKIIMKKEIRIYMNNLKLNAYYNVLIVGLGNDSHTADSIGPKTLKYIKVNTHLESLGIKIKQNKISALEPGVLGETGIETKRIIESVVEEINPDVVILIDSFVSNDICYLNKTIEISDNGITPGSGILGIQKEINKDTIGIPVITIGVTSAIEVKIKSIRHIPITFNVY